MTVIDGILVCSVLLLIIYAFFELLTWDNPEHTRTRK